MKQFYYFFMVVMLVLVGCSANVENELSADLGRPQKDENDGALTVVEAEAAEETAVEDETDEEAMEEQIDLTEEPVSENEASNGDTQVSEPVVVDMSELTPQPVDPNEEPREMPRPGVPVNVPNSAQDLADSIFADLGQTLAIDVNDIQLLQWDSVTWRDGSLGCPEAGMMYTQALVNGYSVLLEANGQQYYYHTNNRSQFIQCDKKNRQDPAPGGTLGDA